MFDIIISMPALRERARTEKSVGGKWIGWERVQLRRREREKEGFVEGGGVG